MQPALRRHLRELPWTDTGLSLTQRLVLQLLAEGERTAGEAYRDLMVAREPLPWLGDLMFLTIIEEMAGAAVPPFRTVAEAADGNPFRRRLALAPAGQEVLAGRRDWLSLGPPVRWVGGVRVAPGQPGWRWDEVACRPVARSAAQ